MKTSTPYSYSKQYDFGLIGPQQVHVTCFIENNRNTYYTVNFTYIGFQPVLDGVAVENENNIKDFFERRMDLKLPLKEEIIRKYLATREKISQIAPVEEPDPRDAA